MTLALCVRYSLGVTLNLSSIHLQQLLPYNQEEKNCIQPSHTYFIIKIWIFFMHSHVQMVFFFSYFYQATFDELPYSKLERKEEETVKEVSKHY